MIVEQVIKHAADLAECMNWKEFDNGEKRLVITAGLCTKSVIRARII